MAIARLVAFFTLCSLTDGVALHAHRVASNASRTVSDSSRTVASATSKATLNATLNATLEQGSRGLRVHRGVEQHHEVAASSGILTKTEVRHALRVCNAYPSTYEVDLFMEGLKMTDTPMAYKTCREFEGPIHAGDKLQFKVGEVSAGTFMVSDLPAEDAMLMLIIYRHDTVSTAVAFESHVFANLINAQIAVLDTFKGRKNAVARIQDTSESKFSRSEELRYDSVVAVNAGMYQVVLASPSNDTDIIARDQLVALNRESYVVLRCGVDSSKGESYPEELIVFPKSDPKALTGASTRSAFSMAFAFIGAFVMAVV